VINNLINLANYLDESGFKREADGVDALIKSATPELIDNIVDAWNDWWDNDAEVLNIPGYSSDWIEHITGPEFAHGPSPAFRMYVNKDGTPSNVNSKLINDPSYYPTESQIKQDPRFCHSDVDTLRTLIGKYCDGGACGDILKALGRDDGDVKSYRQLLSFDEYGDRGSGVSQLHLKFDSSGKMILKDMRAPKGESHTGGSHWDSAVYWSKFDIPLIGEICAPVDVGALLKHLLTDAVPGNFIDKTEELFGDEESYGYHPYTMTGSFPRHDRMDVLEYWEDETPLFVYGTLRKGEKNHKKLKGAEFLGKKTLKGFRRTEGHGPAIVPGNKDDSVNGELYSVDLETLKEIDEYEGEEYIRELVELNDQSKAYAYVYSPIE